MKKTAKEPRTIEAVLREGFVFFVDTRKFYPGDTVMLTEKEYAVNQHRFLPLGTTTQTKTKRVKKAKTEEKIITESSAVLDKGFKGD